MDFLTHLPRTSRKHDVVWVIVDRLTKSAHFLAVQMIFTLEEFCKLYIRDIVRLHGVPVSIISDRDPRFTAQFWKSFQRVMGMQLMMSIVFHPQIDDQSERTIHVLEDMLRACIWISRVARKSIFPWSRSLITIVIRRVYRWHPVRHYMGGHTNLQFVGLRCERDPPRVRI